MYTILVPVLAVCTIIYDIYYFGLYLAYHKHRIRPLRLITVAHTLLGADHGRMASLNLELKVAILRSRSLVVCGALENAKRCIEVELHRLQDQLGSAHTVLVPLYQQLAKVPRALSLSLCVCVCIWPLSLYVNLNNTDLQVLQEMGRQKQQSNNTNNLHNSPDISPVIHSNGANGGGGGGVGILDTLSRGGGGPRGRERDRESSGNTANNNGNTSNLKPGDSEFNHAIAALNEVVKIAEVNFGKPELPDVWPPLSCNLVLAQAHAQLGDLCSQHRRHAQAADHYEVSHIYIYIYN